MINGYQCLDNDEVYLMIELLHDVGLLQELLRHTRIRLHLINGSVLLSVYRQSQIVIFIATLLSMQENDTQSFGIVL